MDHKTYARQITRVYHEGTMLSLPGLRWLACTGQVPAQGRLGHLGFFCGQLAGPGHQVLLYMLDPLHGVGTTSIEVEGRGHRLGRAGVG